jgi:putative transposase
MGRLPRIQVPDVVYHVGSRGVEKRPIFDVIAGDRAFFLALLEQTVLRHKWLCHAYCLMGNHFHLAVETPEANLAAGMQYLKSRYAIWFNDVCGREGALFERRYFSELAETEAHAYELIRYIALNPVRARLCAHPREWPWGSYPALVGLVKTPAFLCSKLVHDLYGEGERGITLFERAVEDAIALLQLQRAA